MKKILFLFLFINLFANVTLTKKEKEFIKEHPLLIIGTSVGWEPYSITNKDGYVEGFDVDVLNLITKYTGLYFVEQTGNWVEMQQLVKEKEIDGLAALIKTKKREKYLNFSIPYTSVVTSILVKKGNPKHIYSEKDLEGKIIALQKGNVYNQKLAKRWKKSKIIWLDNYIQLFEAVIYGKADATYDTGISEYILSKHGLPFLDRAFHLGNKLDLTFAIRKDYPEAISIMNKALQNIPESEFIRLRTKWLLYSPSDYILTKEEKKYLTKPINVCLNKDFAPISFYNKKYQGINVDVLKIIEKNLNKKFNFTDKNCDVYAISQKNKYRQTIPYLKYEIVVISNNNANLLNHFEDIKNKTIVLKDEKIISLLKEKFKNIHILKVNSLKQQFELAQKGYITLTIMPIFKYYKNKYNLKIIGYMNEKYNISMGVKDEILLSIMNKELKIISYDTIKAIEDKWTSIKVIKKIDYKSLLIISIVFLIIISLILFWIKILHKHKKLLKLAKQKADENAKLKDEFLSIMSHEIRTPLNGMIGMSELVLKTQLNKEQKKYLTSINQNSKQLLNIINDILDFAKLQKGKLELSIIQFDLFKLVNDIIELFKPEAEKKSLKIKLNFNANKIVYGDNTKISQILINLIGNAIKFTQEGEITISIIQKGDIFRFEVIDTGIGMDLNTQKKLFTSFTQADSSIHRKYGGSGLGLAISKQLVELMNGKIWVESKLNKGSKFIFEIPLNSNTKSIEITEKELVFGEYLSDIDKNFEKQVKIELKEKIKTNQPKIINPYLDEISNHTFSKELQMIINLAKEYRFKEALKLL